MGNRYKTEEVETEKLKVLFIDRGISSETVFVHALITHLAEKLDTYILTEKKLPAHPAKEISKLSIHFFASLENSLYATCIYISNEKKAKETVGIIQALSEKCSRVIILIPRAQSGKFLDVIRDVQDADNVIIAYLGEVFDQGGKGFFTEIITQALINRKITIRSNDVCPVYVISQKDLLVGIDYLLFSHITRGCYIALYYSRPATFISLVHALQRIEPDISIRHDAVKNISSYPKINNRFWDIPKSLGSEKNIDTVFTGFENELEVLYEKINKAHFKRKTSKLKKRTFSQVSFFRFFLVLAAAAFLFFIFSLGMVGLSIFYANLSFQQVEKGNIELAMRNSQTAKILFETGKPPVLGTLGLLGESKWYSYVRSYEFGLTTYGQTLQLLQEAIEMKKVSKQNVDIGIANVQFLYFLFTLQDSIPIQPKKLETLERFIAILEPAKYIAGFSKEMRYLLLFQNSNELRPTGGFIGSVGEVVVNEGLIEDVIIHDVYDVDGQITQHVEPHFVIRRYLQPHLYLRDSNFNPDFQESAASAALLYEHATGQKVDGVIAITSEVLVKIVDIVGPISVPGQKEAFTKDSIIKLMQESIQSDFFPGSREKQQLLQAVFHKIITTLEGDTKKQMQVISLLPDLLQAKDILLSVNNAAIQKSIIANEFGGSFKELRIEKDVLQDTLSINEANIGVNKANEFISREVAYDVFLKNNKLQSEAKIQYENSEDMDYTMYLRLLIPKAAQITQISLDQVPQEIVPAVTDRVFYERSGFVAPEGLEVAREDVSNQLASHGFLVVVPKKSSKEITVQYESQIPSTLPARFIYSLSFIKQPGTKAYPLQVALQGDGYKLTAGKAILFKNAVVADEIINASVQKTIFNQ